LIRFQDILGNIWLVLEHQTVITARSDSEPKFSINIALILTKQRSLSGKGQNAHYVIIVSHGIGGYARITLDSILVVIAEIPYEEPYNVDILIRTA